MELKRVDSMPILTQQQLDAVPKIQNAWRSYTNRKVYHYYRDIILLKTQTKPAQLLKAVNPCEAQLLEKSSNLHIRFRLGGERFPPKIYYKVYVHGGMVDMNSFAPRDYSSVPKDGKKGEKKMYYKEYKEKKPQHDGWYIRQENNGWRPLQIKAPVKKDFVEVATAHKVKYYHHDKDLRKKKNEKQKRLNKLRWFQTMFEKARDEEPMLKEQANPFEDPQLIDMDDDEFKNEVNELIEWSDNLDFDSYTNYWKQMSTADYSGSAIQGSMRRNRTPSPIDTECESVN